MCAEAVRGGSAAPTARLSAASKLASLTRGGRGLRRCRDLGGADGIADEDGGAAVVAILGAVAVDGADDGGARARVEAEAGVVGA